ncbi:P-loop NTPase fold protein [Chishuiella sp.]|uniref:KAP family P-loop NTPase fold protein n=1 Tax=Chishuiella sp. TaxID=1969467 RepID=UPI0028AB3C00|nr:P-loop NTPase fold protein [Chishuiella sp.]
MKVLSKVKYFDFFLLLAIVPTVLIVSFWYYNRIKEKGNQKSDFYDDIPINSSEEDILNRKQKAIQVARLIKGNKSKTSLAIGIVGEWGNGKTSFMNFIEESFVDEKDYIIVHFNSWLNISINSIINDFFNTIEKKISIYSIDISKELKKYGNNVLSINKNSTTETLLNAINIIPDNSLSDNFENLNTLLNKLDKKVIVFFDDIDRLQPNEVFEVLKLIRNTASFDVFNYVVGYDKAYLNIALEKNNIPFSDRYYEKIFLKEFPLPPIKQADINDFIKKGILLFETEKEEELESFFNLYNAFNFNGENVFESISNIRNAKRFLNELKLSIENIKDDIYLHDFILIKLLKFSYYDVYRLLFSKNNYLENSDNVMGGIHKYTHYKLKRINSKEGGVNSFSKSVLNEDVKSLGMFSSSELSIIGFICERIFGDGYGSFDVDQNAITYGHNYYRYFEDELFESNISNAEFNDFMIKSLEDKKEFVNDVYKNDRLIGLTLFLYKVKIYKDLESKEEYEVFIKILFYISRLKSKDRIFKYQGIDFDFLYNCMNDYNDLFISKFGYKNIEEVKLFFKSLFYEQKDYYDFECDFVKFLYDRHGHSDLSLPLNKKEIDKFLIFCFDNNSKSINGIDEKFWDCYQLCFVKDWQIQNNRSWNSISKTIDKNRDKLIYDIIPKYYIEFLMYCIKPQDWFGEGKNSFKIGLSIEVINKLFNSVEGFISYLESNKFREKIEQPFDFLEEFILFVKEFNKTKQNIDFEFKYQPVIDKLNKEKLKWNKN